MMSVGQDATLRLGFFLHNSFLPGRRSPNTMLYAGKSGTRTSHTVRGPYSPN